jgi:hypothetical protein
MPSPELSRDMMEAMPDPVWWHLLLSDLTGGASLVQMEAWPVPVVVRYLIAGEVMESRARWDRMRAGRP